MQGPELLDRLHPRGTRITYGSHEMHGFEPMATRAIINLLDPQRSANVIRAWPTDSEIANQLINQFTRTDEQLVDYFEGHYHAAHKGGIGNPTAFFLYSAFTAAWLETFNQLRGSKDVDKPLPDYAYQNTQDILFGQAIAFDSVREELIDEKYNGNRGAYLKDSDSTERAHFEGLMTEYEAAYMLAEIALRQEVIVLPAPGFLERRQARNGHWNTNIDFILFDPKSKESVGIQVKSRVDDGNIDAINARQGLVYLFNGREHLDNSAKATNQDDPRSPEVTGTYGGAIIKNRIQYFANTRGRDDTVRVLASVDYEILRKYNEARQQKGRRHTPKSSPLEVAYVARVDHLWKKIRGYIGRSDDLGAAPVYLNEIARQRPHLIGHSSRKRLFEQ